MRAGLIVAAALLACGCLSFDTSGKVFACDPSSGADCDGGSGTGTTTAISHPTSTNGTTSSGNGSDTGTSATTSTIGTNSGNGTTSASTSSGTTGTIGTIGGYDDASPSNVALGDVDGDGRVDLVERFNIYDVDFLEDSQAILEVRLGDGDGGFTKQIFLPLEVDGGYGRGLEVVKLLNTAGDTAIISAGDDSRINVILCYPDAGLLSLGPIDARVGQSRTLNRFATGDFDGDGTTDLIVATDNGPDGLITLFKGQGDGTFTAGQPLPMGDLGAARGLAIGDFNGDHILDVGACDDNSPAIGWGAGDGGFASWSPVDAGNQGSYLRHEVAAADLNGDGYDDFFISATPQAPTGAPLILWGRDGGQLEAELDAFQPDWYLSQNGSYDEEHLESFQLVDLDGDGVLDLVANVNDNQQATFVVRTFLLYPDAGLKAASTGFWATHSQPFDSDVPPDVGVGDLNGDQLPDLAVAGNGIEQPVIVLGPGQ